MKRTLVVLMTVFLLNVCLCVKAQGVKGKKYNVLFVFVDDLRPDLGCYGNGIVQTPHLDRFASTATLFKKHYVTVPTCAASRVSILTGMLPRSVNDLSNEAFEHKKVVSIGKQIPESFVHTLRNDGYYTIGIGKISHSPDGYIYPYTAPKGTEQELPDSWNEMLLNPGKWGTGWNAFFGYSNGSNRNSLHGVVKPYENADVDDDDFVDGLTANLAIEKLQEAAKRDQPFFFGVGFFKPHLPFNAPKKYWDLYDETKLPLTPSPGIPENVSVASFHQSAEFNGYRLGEEKASLSKPVSDRYARRLRHAYYASVSYVDAQIGKVLAELKRLDLDKNTIVVVWGDHGWHLGDHRVWGKHTLSEYALRSPLMIKVPGFKGANCDKVVSSIDVYPTLMELCGVKGQAKTDGKSLLPLIKNVHHWQNVAYSYYRKGITVRTDNYRLTQYFRKEQPAIELYNHKTDPFENVNIAEAHPEIIKNLLPILTKGNTGLYDQPQNEQGKQRK